MAGLVTELNFVKACNTGLSDDFGKAGQKIGSTIRIPKPSRYIARGDTDITGHIQTIVEEKEDFSISRVANIAVSADVLDMHLSIDKWQDKHANPIAQTIASTIEATIMGEVYKQTAQRVGTYGTAPTTLAPFGQAAAMMTKYGVPNDGNRSVFISPDTNVSMVEGLKGLFQDSGEVSKQYIKGMMGRAAGFKWYENALCPSHTNGNNVTGVSVSATPAEGATTLALAGLTPTTGTIKAGQAFTVAGVYGVHPDTKTPYVTLKQLVSTADVTANGSGIATVTLVEPLYSATSLGRQNISALPVTSGAVVFAGAASAISPMSLAMHKDAVSVVFVDLSTLPCPGAKSYTASYKDFRLTVWEQFDINTRQTIYRFEVVYGFKLLRPERLVAIWG